MAGVIIDVEESGSEKASRNLKSLNKQLADIFTNANKADASLKSNKSGTAFKGVTKEANAATKSVNDFRIQSAVALRSTATGIGGISLQLKQFRNAAVALGVTFAALRLGTEFAKAGDQINNMQNRLKLVNKDMAEVIRLQKTLGAVANSTRSDFDNTVNTFVTLARSTKELGISQTRLIKVSETLNKANALSGSSFESVASAMVQLNQGLASGQLRGQELRSVLEQSGYLGQELAKSLGLTTGQMYAFAEAGKLSSKVVIGALEKMAKTVDADFAATTGSVSTSFRILKQQIALGIGDLSNYVGINKKISANFLVTGNTFARGMDTIIERTNVAKLSFKNYVREMSSIKTDFFQKFNTSPVAIGIQQRSSSMVKALQSFFDKEKNIDIPESKLQKLFGRFKQPKGEDPSFFNPEEIRKNVRLTIDLIAQTFSYFQSSMIKLKGLVPVIAGPVANVFSEGTRQLVIFGRTLETDVYKKLLPLSRKLEEVSELVNVFGKDNEIARGYVELFQSKSLKEFVDNFEKLNQARNSFAINLSDLKGTFSAPVDQAKQFTYAIEDTAISLGLVENRLIRIRDTRFDQIKGAFLGFGAIIKRVYSDIFAPDVNLVLSKFRINAQVIGDALIDGFANTFNFASGVKLSKALAAGLVAGLKTVASAIGTLFGKIFEKDYFSKSIAEQLYNGIVVGIGGTISFLAGIFVGFTDGLAKSLSGLSFGEMFDALKEGTQEALSFIQRLFKDIFDSAAGPLRKVERRVSEFGDFIKETFFDIWDAVVGHSYWPDTIDGIVDYTRKLGGAEGGISSFKDFIITGFSNLGVQVAAIFKTISLNTEEFTNTITKIDWGDAVSKLATSFGGIFAAAFVLMSGSSLLSGKVKLFAIGYFFSLFNDITNGAVLHLGPLLGEMAGRLAGEFINNFAESMFDFAVVIGKGFASFISALLDEAFPPFGAFASKLFNLVGNVVPLFSNEVIHGVLGIAAAYAILSKTARVSIGNLLFGTLKKGKDGEATRQADGILGTLINAYSGLIGSIPGTVAKSNAYKLAGKLFSSPTFALAASGIMALGFTDAFGMVSATFAALPFFAIALFGRDGGARLLAELGVQWASLLGNIVLKGFEFIKKIFPKDSFLAQLAINALGGFTSVFGGFRKSLSGTQSGIVDGLRSFGSNIGVVLNNIIKNRDAYAKKQLSLGELFGTGDNGKGGRKANTNFTAAFTQLAGGIKGKKVFGSNVGALLKDGRKAVVEGASEIKTAFLNYFAAFDRSISAGASRLPNMFGKLKDALQSALLFALSPLRTTFGKFAVFGALAIGLASIASASTGAADAVGLFGSNIAGLVIGVGGTIVAVNLLAKSFRGLRTFSSAKNSFIDDKIRDKLAKVRDGLVAQRDIKVNTFKKENPFSNARGFKKELDADMEKELSKRKRRLEKGVSGANAAGLTAATAGLSEKFNAVARRINTTFLSKDFWMQRIQGIRSMGAELRKLQIKGLLGSIGTSVAVGASGLAAGGVKGGIGVGSKKLIGGIGSLAGGVAGGALAAAGGLGTALLPIIGTIGLIAGGFVLLAATITGLFGPFESFGDNLKFFGDKLIGFLGFEAQSNVGKGAALSKEFGNLDIDGKKVGLGTDIRNIDYNKLAPSQLAAIKANLGEFKTTTEQFNDLAAKQGKLTEGQQRDAEAAIANIRELLARYPFRADAEQKENPFLTKTKTNNEKLFTPDNGIGSRIDRFLGLDTANEAIASFDEKYGLDQPIQRLFDKIGKDATDAGEILNRNIGKPTAGFFKSFGIGVVETFRSIGQAINDDPNFKALRERSRDKRFDGTGGEQAKRVNNAKQVARLSPFATEDELKDINTLEDAYLAAMLRMQNSHYSYAVDGTYANYLKRQKEEKAELDRIKAALDKGTEAFIRLNEQREKIAKFKKDLAAFSVEMKELGLDFGEDGEKFFGGAKDRKILLGYLALSRNAAKDILGAHTDTAQQIAVANKKAADDSAKAYAEYLEKTSSNEGLIGEQKSLFGDTFSDKALMFMRGDLSGAAALFQTATDEYKKAKTDFDNAVSRGDRKGSNAALKRMLQERKEAISAGAKDFTLEGLNSALGQLSIPTIDMAQYINLPTENIIDLADEIRKTQLAEVALDQAIAAGLGDNSVKAIERTQEAMKALQNQMNQTKLVAAKALNDSVINASKAGVSGTALTAYLGNMGGLPVAPNSEVFRNKGRPDQFNKLTGQATNAAARQALYGGEVQRLVNEGKDVPSNISDGLARAAVDFAKFKEGLDALTQAPAKEKAATKDKYGFKELLADVNEAGIAISELGFARLEGNSRKTLSSVAKQIHDIEEQLEKASPTDDVSSLLANKANLLAQMRSEIVKSFGNTGASLNEIISNNGIEFASKLTAGQLGEIVQYEKEIVLLRAKADDASSIEEYLGVLKQVNKAEADRSLFIKASTDSLNKYAENINEAFSTSLDTLSLEYLDLGFAKRLSMLSIHISSELAKYNETGKSVFGNTDEAVLSAMRSLRSSGELVSVLNGIGIDFADALTHGAKTAFEKMKELYPNYQGSFQQFLKIPKGTRNGAIKEGLAAEQIVKIATVLGDEMPKKLSDILNKYGAGESASSVLAEFQSAAKTGLEARLQGMLGTPTEQLKTVAEQSRDELQGIHKTLKGQNIFNATAPVSTGGTSLNSAAALGDQFGTVTSTRRSVAHNRKVGGVPNSLHLTGQAVDIARDRGVNHATIVAAYRKAGYEIIEHLDEGDHSHLAFRWAAAVKTAVAEAVPAAVASEPDNIVVTAKRLKSGVNDSVFAREDADRQARDFNRTQRAGLSQRDGDLFNLADSGINVDTLRSATNAQLLKMSAMQDYLRNLESLIAQGNINGIDTSQLQLKAMDTADALGLLAKGIDNLRAGAIDAGENLAQSFDAGVRDTLTAAITGGDWKSALKGFLDTFTKSIIDGFVNGLMEPITGENGIFSNMFRRLGQGLYGAGGGLGNKIAGGADSLSGGFLGNVAPFATGGPSPLMNSLLSPEKGFSSVMSGGEAVQDGAFLLTDKLPNIATDFASSLDTSFLTGSEQLSSVLTGAAGSGTGAAGALGAGGAGGGIGGMLGGQAGIAGILGILAGNLLAKLFSGGGMVGRDGAMPKFAKGGMIPGFKGGGFLKFLSPLLLLLGSTGIMKKKAGGLIPGFAGGGFLKMLSPLLMLLTGGFGGAQKKAGGGKFAGPGTGTSDSIPAWVSNGEYIINEKSTRAYLPVLEAINKNKFAVGGLVGSAPSTSSVNMRPAKPGIDPRSMGKAKAGTTVNLRIIGDISRQTRRHVYEMLPQITDGVNSNNRESGFTSARR
jgi:tape measure domain-containing protein